MPSESSSTARTSTPTTPQTAPDQDAPRWNPDSRTITFSPSELNNLILAYTQDCALRNELDLLEPDEDDGEIVQERELLAIEVADIIFHIMRTSQ